MYRCKCDCGNEIITSSICLIGNHTNSCGCLVSYWNMYIEKFLNKNNIKNQPEYPVIIDSVRYQYDFYLPEYNLMIEYDGIQHYEPMRFHGENSEENLLDFKKQQRRDKIKDKYCEDNNINLLRIPYWETKNIETIINNHLQRLSEKGLAM
uniref:Restriction enzyme n=1 Tax=Siphoviridae sp. ctg6c78 TaxID=2825603 RepID=A0A8S5URC0_9CAUD|nr:MAG TPA: restriction enzyme [Siphoviridae sp. ctg6c78]